MRDAVERFVRKARSEDLVLSENSIPARCAGNCASGLADCFVTISGRQHECRAIRVSGHYEVTGVISQDRDNQGNLGKKQGYTGKVIIGATYEADLAEFAKIPYRIGREARSAEEPHAGKIYTNFFRGVPGTLKATILPTAQGKRMIAHKCSPTVSQEKTMAGQITLSV